MEKLSELQCSESDSIHYSQTSVAESTYFDVYSSSDHQIPVVSLPGERYHCARDIKVTESDVGQMISNTLSHSGKQASLSDVVDTETDDQTSQATQQSNNSDDDLFECGICTEDLKTPKSLPCLHNFCLECLEKYLLANNLHPGQTFNCPTCRAVVKIPQGGTEMFPTNFHIVNLRRRNRELDMGHTIKEAIQYLENRAEDIVDEMTERKRQVLIAISQRRGEIVSKIDDVAEALLQAVEEQYGTDSTKCVDTISAVKEKLAELQVQLEGTYLIQGQHRQKKQTEAIELNALTKLRRQAEIISNLNNELEELKQQADEALTNILNTNLAFSQGRCSSNDLNHIFGQLVMLTDGQTVADILGNQDTSVGHLSPLHIKSWSQSWWMLLFAVLPAILCAMLVKIILTFFERLLGL